MFGGANSNEDVLRIISNLEYEAPKLIKKKVNLYDDKIDGNHSYTIHMLDGTITNIAIW